MKLVVILLLSFAVLGLLNDSAAAQGKRFDCRIFCRLTGYHGMIGGCRCSFTLFTAKRSDPTSKMHDWNSLEDGEPLYQDKAEEPEDDKWFRRPSQNYRNMYSLHRGNR